MDILILGGTLFLGRYLVQAAQAHGHTVTLFNRGQTNPELFLDVETLRGDRDGNLDALAGRRWDAVIDTCGYVPRVVSASATLLADAMEQYVFISSCSVYRDFSMDEIDEDGPVITLEDPTTEKVMEAYGGLKLLCEQAVEAAMPGRALMVRAGLLVGPYDPTGRFTYWPRRVGEGGRMLAPGRPDRPVQFIHTGDMAEWIIRMIEGQEMGVYNVTGPAETLTMDQLLQSCIEVTESDAQFEWVSEEFLLEHEVGPFMELPLWVPEESNGIMQMKIDRALDKGLKFRSLTETVQDVSGNAGLSPEREAELLAAFTDIK